MGLWRLGIVSSWRYDAAKYETFMKKDPSELVTPAQQLGALGGKARSFAKREAGKANLAKARERKKQLALDNKRLLE